MQEKDPIFVKVIIVGDSGVGKTSLLNRFCYSKFDPTLAPTIGTDFSTKILKKNETTMRLQLWDVAGQERFKAVSKMYIRGCLGCIMVSDALQEKSLKSLIEWKKIVVDNADYLGEDYRIPFMILDNKIDLLRNPNDSDEEYNDTLRKKKKVLDDFAVSNGIDEVFLTSAKENINLDEAFSCLAEKILAQLDGKKKEKDKNFGPLPLNRDFVLDSPPKQKKKCCLG